MSCFENLPEKKEYDVEWWNNSSLWVGWYAHQNLPAWALLGRWWAGSEVWGLGGELSGDGSKPSHARSETGRSRTREINVSFSNTAGVENTNTHKQTHTPCTAFHNYWFTLIRMLCWNPGHTFVKYDNDQHATVTPTHTQASSLTFTFCILMMFPQSSIYCFRSLSCTGC